MGGAPRTARVGATRRQLLPPPAGQACCTPRTAAGLTRPQVAPTRRRIQPPAAHAAPARRAGPLRPTPPAPPQSPVGCGRGGGGQTAPPLALRQHCCCCKQAAAYCRPLPQSKAHAADPGALLLNAAALAAMPRLSPVKQHAPHARIALQQRRQHTARAAADVGHRGTRVPAPVIVLRSGDWQCGGGLSELAAHAPWTRVAVACPAAAGRLH